MAWIRLGLVSAMALLLWCCEGPATRRDAEPKPDLRDGVDLGPKPDLRKTRRAECRPRGSRPGDYPAVPVDESHHWPLVEEPERHPWGH